MNEATACALARKEVEKALGLLTEAHEALGTCETSEAHVKLQLAGEQVEYAKHRLKVLAKTRRIERVASR